MKTLLLLCLFTTSLFARVSPPELLAVATDQGGYPAPSLCYFSNTTMVPHPEGVLVTYTCFGGPDLSAQIWLVGDSPRKIGESQMGNLFTHPYLLGEKIFFLEYSEFETKALWENTAGVLTRHELPTELKNSHVHDLALLGNEFRFRWTNTRTRAHGEGIFDGNFRVFPKRDDVEFIYKAFGTGDIFLQKIKFVNGEAIELRIPGKSAPVIVLRDSKMDPSSPFTSLRSQFAVHGKNWVTIATTEEGMVLVRGKGGEITVENLSTHFKEIQHWPPALAASGEVFFRGKDHQGEYALWGYQNGKVRTVVSSGMEIEVGSELVVTSSRSLMYNSPVFDSEGRLYLGVGLRDPNASSDFGQGILRLGF